LELQFYLLVPLLFFIFGHLDKKHKSLKFILIFLIALISFGIQSALTGDLAHMLLFSRLWQFMAGFAAYHLYESSLLNVENLWRNRDGESGDKKKGDDLDSESKGKLFDVEV
jgi:peptidoglycan/LPS O-acetylase OafA/YrhL